MSTRASEIIKLAQSWIGKKESDGSHKDIIDIYNSDKPLARNYKVSYNDSWCATFISALAIKQGATDIIPKECGCGEMIKLCQMLGIWVEDDAHVPAVGTLIFYDFQDNGVGENKGWPDHVGVVEKISGTTITVIEGNINDTVGRRTIKVNDKCIRGYAVPKYDAEPVQKPTSTATSGIVAGKKVTLNKTKCYNSESAPAHYGTKSGTYYLWSNEVVNGRIRITNKPERVGVKKQVTCWVNVADLGLATTTTATAKKIKAGDVFSLKKVAVYSSENSATIGNRTGTYYAWEDEPKDRKRIKMTNKKERVGVEKQVSFFVAISDL